MHSKNNKPSTNSLSNPSSKLKKAVWLIILINSPKMLSPETQRRLARLLFQMSECEKSIERSRQGVCSNPNFDMYSIFQLLDVRTNGKLEVTDLKAYLSRLGISVLRNNLALLIKQYDSNNDERLSLEEFQALVLPSEDLQLRKEVLSRNVHPITPYTENAIARHLELEASYQEQLETLKKSLVSRADFNPIDAFRVIDIERLNFINVYEISNFLKKHGYSVTMQELDGIIRRIDTDGDSKINYEDFTAMVIPCKKDRPQSAPRKNLNQSPLRKSSARTSPIKSSYNSPNKSSYSTNKSSYSPNKSSYQYSPSKSINRPVRSKLFTTIPYEDMQLIVNMFLSQIRLDLDIERERIILTKRPEFNLVDFFRVFDINDKNFFSSSDVEGLLRDLRVPYDVDEVYLLIRHFSSYKDSVVRFSDFERMFVPRDKYFAQMLKERKGMVVPPYNRLSIFSTDTIEQIIRILRLQLQSESVAENIRKSITSKKWINFYEIFEDIDVDRDGLITIGEFQEVFNRHNEFVSLAELETLIERYDKDFDRRVSYSEFIEEITPKLFI